MEFNCLIEEIENYAVLKISGNLIEKSQAIEMLDELDELILKDIKNFVIDMSEFKYLNSTGLNIFINILTKARKAGGEVVICSVPSKIKELLIITKLNTVFTVSENTSEAIKALSLN